MGDETVLLPAAHLEDCAGPDCRATCLALVSRLGVGAMRTHYHVEQDGHLIGGRQNRRPTACTMAIRLSKERPEARWRVVPCDGSLWSERPAVGRRPGGPPSPRIWV